MSDVERFSHYVAMSRPMAARRKRELELHRIRQARYRHKYPAKVYESGNKARNAKRLDKARNAEFIFWDGETPRDGGYALFGNSAGYEICHKFISSEECLELIMECELEHPDAIHISFGFNLDVSYILKDLPRRALTRLHWWGKTIWGDWEIEHIPHKWFTVKRGQVKARIYDMHTFFPGNYVSALVKFNVGSKTDLSIITSGKAQRPDFMWADIEEIREYWRIECKLGPLLAEAVREALDRASYVPRSWHGPGAVARMALKRHNIYDAMAITPKEVQKAARYAYAGGRAELVLAGHIPGPIYEADINSAYPFYALQLPNLARGKWRKGREYEAGKFAVYHIRYSAPYDPIGLYPLFRRYDDGLLSWTNEVEGWYWGPEAELVKNDDNATFIESLVFDEVDVNDRPFAFLGDYFRRRKEADARGDILAYPYKIIINAIYGQLAQRAGWNRQTKKPPRSHQLEWAGFITSACRAAVYKAAIAVGDKLISISTDSVQALCPIPVPEGKALGEWGIDQFSEGIVWQSGIYFLREELGYDPALGYGWIKARTRGIPKGTYTAEDLRECVSTMDPLTINKHNFIGYGMADNGQWASLNTWKDEPHDFYLGGSGKRTHYMKGGMLCKAWCRKYCNGDTHRLQVKKAERPFKDFDPDNPLRKGLIQDIMSVPHWLPWLDGPDRGKQMVSDMEIWDLDALDPDEEWVMEYA